MAGLGLRSACLSILSAGIKGVSQHTWLFLIKIFLLLCFLNSVCQLYSNTYSVYVYVYWRTLYFLLSLYCFLCLFLFSLEHSSFSFFFLLPPSLPSFFLSLPLSSPSKAESQVIAQGGLKLAAILCLCLCLLKFWILDPATVQRKGYKQTSGKDSN